MPSSYTTNVGLNKPADNDSAWGVPWRAALDQIDALGAIGPLAVAFHEQPSTTLNVSVAAGSYRKADGTIATYAGTASQSMTTAATNYVYLTDSGTLTVNTTGFPAATNIVRLATVVAGATTITSITDARIPWKSFGAAGSLLYLSLSAVDTGGVVTVTTGTTNGVMIGATTSNKLAFFGSTPVVQPTNASEAAAAAITTVTLTDSTGGTAATTFAAITAGASYAQADMVSAKNALAQLVLSVNQARADLTAIRTLTNQLRSDLVTLGLIKGS